MRSHYSFDEPKLSLLSPPLIGRLLTWMFSRQYRAELLQGSRPPGWYRSVLAIQSSPELDVLTAANFDHVSQGRDVERPGVLQQMLLAGIAVDSPADAAALHPGHFRNANEAKMAFGRAAFKGQTPIYSSYREMTLKSAAYRRAGRGRGWQRAMWVEGDAATARQRLEVMLGDLAEWRPE